jgi:hypothetical protein
MTAPDIETRARALMEAMRAARRQTVDLLDHVDAAIQDLAELRAELPALRAALIQARPAEEPDAAGWKVKRLPNGG